MARCLFVLSLVHTSDGSRDGDGYGSYQSNRPEYDGRGDGSLTLMYIILTTFKMADGEDILLFVSFYIASPSEKKAKAN